MNRNPIRVLLIEDNPGDARLIQEMLGEGKGWIGALECVESLAEGLLRIARGGIDVVLLDLGLPDSAGLDTLRRLRAGAPQAPVVVVMSGIGDEEVGMQAVQEGAQDYLVKGQVGSGLLIRSIRYAIERNEAEKALLQARDELESQVRERTASLTQAIASLEKENAERKKAEALLRESEEKYRGLIQRIQAAVVVHGADTQILASNLRAQQLLGLTEEQMMGKSAIDPTWHFFREDGTVMPVEEYPVNRVLTSGEPLRDAVAGIHRPGIEEDIWVLISADPVTEKGGEITQVIVTFMDITEQKRAEEALRRLNTELDRRVLERTAQLEATNQELEGFVYSISHDLRAPLRHIDGFIELLQKKAGTNLDEQSLHYMDTISDAAQKMGRLIDDLLAFSRMGRHEMSSTQVDLGALVQDVVRELQPETEGRNVSWQLTDLPTVMGDRAMLRMVLVNLIANAIKFTRPRQQAQIEIGTLPGETSETVIFVRDNGVGFDMTYANRLFGVFQRLHRTDEFEGTGIGLANVRRIIARHGGRIWAEGAVDQGATFYFSLPQAWHLRLNIDY